MLKPGSVLLIGGYGATGRQVARLLRARNPDLQITIAGRDRDKAVALARDLGNARAMALDISAAASELASETFAVMAVFAKDHSLATMDFAGGHGIPYICISSGAFEIGPEVAHGMVAGAAAPIVLASHWFSGAPLLATLDLASRFRRVHTIRTSILCDRAMSGAVTSDFDRIFTHGSSLLRRDGRYVWLRGAEADAEIRNLNGTTVPAKVAISYDAMSLGAAVGASNITVLQAFGPSASRERGEGASTEIVIELEGTGTNGDALMTRRTLVCRDDKLPLTAFMNVLLVERLTGRNGTPPPPGLYLPERILDGAAVCAALIAAGADLHDDQDGNVR